MSRNASRTRMGAGILAAVIAILGLQSAAAHLPDDNATSHAGRAISGDDR